jgi:hypothetical protein
MSDIIKKEIIVDPKIYFDSQKQSLQKRIENVKLTQEEEDGIIDSKTTKTIRDKVLGLFKVGEVINTILNWNEEIDSEIKEAKKQILLSSYFDKADQTEDSVEKLKSFLTNPQGNTIFNKILRILDNEPPDFELTNHLSTVLKHIVNSDFQNLFEDHKFALNQIETLTPQALTLLSDYNHWTPWELKSYSSEGGRLTHDWIPEFINVYCNSKGINDSKIKFKMSHSMNDLLRNRYLKGSKTNREKIAAAFLTDIGKIVVKYIE